MKCSGPYRYQLILSGSEKDRRIDSKFMDGVPVNFSHPLSLNRRPKIYVIKLQDEIVYVGYTSQSIGSRLNLGLKASGKNGYHGYKWKVASQVELFVFVFEKELTGNQKEDKPTNVFMEAIEAELVFRHRADNGHWPEHQNEIHFNNTLSTADLEIVKKIYAEVESKTTSQGLSSRRTAYVDKPI